jgi:dTDP-4-dehydrorhamnose 3,5-epimerase
MLKGATKDKQTRTSDWRRVMPMIDGVTIKSSRPVVTQNGTTVETYRSDWAETGRQIGHVIHVTLLPGKLTAWHCHEKQTDGIFVIAGRAFLGLYDARDGSPTKGTGMRLRLDAADPTLVTIPPLVWHGIKVLIGPMSFLNLITHPYDYEAPDEWRVPPDHPEIPIDIINAD